MNVYEQKENLRRSLLVGSQKLADNVGATLGPKGHNVVIHKRGTVPLITKDGVTVAQFIDSENVFEQIAIDVIKQASEQTNLMCGDGTTSSSIIANAILKEANRYIVSGYHPFELKNGIDKMTELIVKEIKLESISVDSIEDIHNVANIASNGDQVVAKLLSEAVEQVGRDGAISIVEGQSRKTSLSVVEGFTFDSGICHRSFITDEREGSCRMQDLLLLITDHKLEKLDKLKPTLQLIARMNKPLAIIAEDFGGEVLSSLIVNTERGKLKIAAIKAPRYGEERRLILEDLCISSGATFMSRESGLNLEDITLDHFGTCESLESNSKRTIIVDPQGLPEKINDRMDALKQQVKDTDKIEEAKRIQERITRISSAIAIISVGANTEVEMRERKHRIEDALESVVSAQEQGIVPGGGITLLKISRNLKDITFDTEAETMGGKALLSAIQEPFIKLCQNANISPKFKMEELKLKEDGIGFNFKTEEYVNMLDSGVIDPAKVSISSVQNAASAAGILLTTSHAISLKEE